MLKTRILTALILAPLVAAAVLWAGFYWVLLLIVAVWALGAHEWATLSQLQEKTKLIYAAAISLLVVGGDWLIRTEVVSLWPLVAFATLWWGTALFWIVRFPRGFSEVDADSGQPINPQTFQKITLGLFVLVPAALALLVLKRFNAEHMLYVLVIVWVADIGAYFAGRAFGTIKMVPKVSPGKSWAGLFGGVFAVCIFAWFAGSYFGLDGSMQEKFAVLALIVSLFSVVGDLTQSMFKRHVSIKDSGNIFPGHGGVLDRLDSLMAAAPVYVCGLYYLEML